MAIKKIEIGKLKIGMVLASPVFVERKGRNVLLMNENTYIASDHQVRRLLDEDVKFVEIDTDKGADTITTLDRQKKWEEIKTEKKDTKAMDSLLSRHINALIGAVTNTIMKTPTSRMIIDNEPASSIIKELLVFVENNTDILLSLIASKRLTNTPSTTRSIQPSYLFHWRELSASNTRTSSGSPRALLWPISA